MDTANKTTLEMLKEIANLRNGLPPVGVAYNIRQDTGCAGRQSTENIRILSKKDKPGIDIRIRENTKGETVYIPACITKSGVNDLVYNDFFVGAGADVTIVAGCGVHTDGHEESQHNGIHRFFLEKGARVLYVEKHIGEGPGDGAHIINPETEVHLGEDSYLEMDTTQLRGVNSTIRKTGGDVGVRAKLLVREKIMTDGAQYAETNFSVKLVGEDSGADLISRSVARGDSRQVFKARIEGLTRCAGHSACDAIIMDKGTVEATPELFAGDVDAALIHEAAIGKIAGEQLIKLMTLGLTAEEAEAKIIEGFLR